MLSVTRRIVEALKQAGLQRRQFRIRTEWNEAEQTCGRTTIELLCSYGELSPHLGKLAQAFKVIVICLDGRPLHVSLDTEAEPGLYKRENGREERVTEIVYQGCFEQLSLWTCNCQPEQSGMCEASAKEETDGFVCSE